MLVTEYDRSELQTVCEFFGPLATAGYNLIREAGLESITSFRDASRTRGRGSRLYRVVDLEKIFSSLELPQTEYLSSLPRDCTDFVGIQDLYGVRPHVASAVFSAVGLLPACKYRSNAKGKPKHGYSTEKVRMVFRGLAKIAADLVD